jgi:hypothetical protein
MRAVRPIRTQGRRRDRRGAVSAAVEEILILSVIVPASWIFYRFVIWWCKVMFDVIAPLVEWAYL